MSMEPTVQQHVAETAARPLMASMRRGFARRCPACGRGRLYGRFLKIRDHCPDCGEALFHQQADDAPPYFTIVILGHILVPLALIAEQLFAPPLWLYLSVLFPAIIGSVIWLLPRVKGALVGMQWAQRMHGFGAAPEPGLD